MIRQRAAAVLAVASLTLACGGADASTDASPDADQPLLVAAAADLQPAFTELGASFEAATGEPVVFSFGSSGQLAQQLIEGAPMDLYASASASFVDAVLDAGVGDPATRETYGVGRLVLWATSDRWLGSDLAALAEDDSIVSIAIANPEHAPYGLAAKQALEAVGVWDALEPTLVYGENIADTHRLAASGNADVAITALSLALAADEQGDGVWVLLDDRLHAPLQQDLVVVATDPDRAELARAFVAHIGSDDGRAVMRRYGFLLPGEDPAQVPGG